MSEQHTLFADVRRGLDFDSDDDAIRSDRDAASEALDDIERAVKELVEAAESLSRPGVQTGSLTELQRGMRMTNAVQALARMAGVSGVYPEIGA